MHKKTAKRLTLEQSIRVSPSLLSVSRRSGTSALRPRPRESGGTSGGIVTGGNHITNQQGTININPPDSEYTYEFRELVASTVPNAMHTSAEVASRGRCLKGTRVATINSLTDYLASTDGPDILWFHGPAGSGKSAVMCTLSNSSSRCASFFFRRYAPDEQISAKQRFIPTLAYQMSLAIPLTRLHLGLAIREEPTIITSNLELQRRKLLEGPFFKAAAVTTREYGSRNFVIFVDGLDDVTDPDNAVEIIDTLVNFANAVRGYNKGRWVKVIVASRPEFAIRQHFQALQACGTAQVFELNPADAELELYYSSEFQKMRVRHGLPTTWPSPSHMRALVGKTSGQYSFAVVAMGYSAEGDPEVNLERVLSTDIVADNPSPFEALNQLYAFILLQIPISLRQDILDVVGFILDDGIDNAALLTDFLSLPHNFIHRLSLYLSSLFCIQDVIFPYHASLADFLFTPERSQRFGLYVPPARIVTLYVKAFTRLFDTSSPTSGVLTVDDRIIDFTMEAAILSSTQLSVNLDEVVASQGVYGCQGLGVVEFLRRTDLTKLDPLSIVLFRAYEFTSGSIKAKSKPPVNEALVEESRRRTKACGPVLPLWYYYVRALVAWSRIREEDMDDQSLRQSLDSLSVITEEVVRSLVEVDEWNLKDTKMWRHILSTWDSVQEYLWIDDVLKSNPGPFDPEWWWQQSSDINALTSFHQDGLCLPPPQRGLNPITGSPSGCNHCLSTLEATKLFTLTAILKDSSKRDFIPSRWASDESEFIDRFCRFARRYEGPWNSQPFRVALVDRISPRRVLMCLKDSVKPFVTETLEILKMGSKLGRIEETHPPFARRRGPDVDTTWDGYTGHMWPSGSSRPLFFGTCPFLAWAKE